MGDISITSVLGPIDNLPAEILEEVFFQCIPSFPTPSPKAAPLLLCLVCSSWCDVALRSSRLWNRLTIDIADLIPRSSLNSEILDLPVMRFLQRSRSRPLSLQLMVSSPALMDHFDLKSRFNAVLDRLHNRIRDLKLPSSRLNKILSSLGPNINFPQLSHFTVTASGGLPFDNLPTPFAGLVRSTYLRRVTFDAHLSSETVLKLLIPWVQLTHVTLNNVDYVSWSHIFPLCTNLQSGIFVISGSPPPASRSSVEVNFPFLESLAIHSHQSSRSPLSMAGYGFPKLKELTLGWNHSPGFETSFLSSIQHLERFTITSPQCHFINMAEVLSILSLIPTITQLRVLNDHCNNELFDALIYHAHQQHPLLQHLRTLHIEIPYWNSMYDDKPMLDALKRMLSSRLCGFPNSKVQQIRALRMITAKDNLVEVKEVFQPLASAGLHLELSAFVVPAMVREKCLDDHS